MCVGLGLGVALVGEGGHTQGEGSSKLTPQGLGTDGVTGNTLGPTCYNEQHIKESA